MLSHNDEDEIGSSSKSAQRGPQDESNNSWDESMLTAAFDRQIKLVQKSLEPPPPPPPAPPASTKSTRSSLKNKTKDNKREVRSEVKADKDLMITHSSRKFRFEEGAQAESSVPDSVSVSTKKTSTKSDQSKAQPASGNMGACMMPPPFDTSKFPEIQGEDEARASMLMSWYMAGYHTGYFEATRKFKKST